MKRLSLICCLVLLLSIFCSAVHVHAEEAAHVEETGHTEDTALLSEEECINHFRWCNESVCMYCGVPYDKDYNVSHTGSTEHNEEEHWMICDRCGKEIYREAHYRYCGESKCGDCFVDYTGDNVKHAGEYAYNAEEHWIVCSNCGYENVHEKHDRWCNENECLYCEMAYSGENVSHRLNWDAYESDAEKHWLSCLVCGVKKHEGEHYRDCDQSVCNECGAAYTGDKVFHDYSEEYETNALQHWQVCERCGEETYRNVHRRYCDESVCYTCGAEYTGSEYAYHTLSDYISDAEGHWRICTRCNKEIDHQSHWRNCNESVCADCGAEYTGEDAAHQFDYANRESNEEYHWAVCTLCGEADDYDVHRRYCDENVCNLCDAPYSGENIDHDWGEYTSDDEYHWYPCTGDGCDAVIGWEHHVHSCTENVCMDCGAEYSGDYIDHDYSWSVYEGDDTHHWRVCEDCGEELYKERHERYCDTDFCGECGLPYSGEELVYHRYNYDEYVSNEQEHWYVCACGAESYHYEHNRYCDQSVCDDCGVAYTGDNVYHNTSEVDWDVYETNAEYHWNICVCGEERSKNHHWRNCGESVCAECGADYTGSSISHEIDWDVYVTNDQYHWFACSDCGAKEELVAHERNCNESVCMHCDAPYTGNNVYHDVEDWYSYDGSDEKSHWHICLGCDEKIFTAAHRRSCDESVCETCGAPYTGENVEHDIDWDSVQSDEVYHWYSCRSCDAILYKNAHYVECYEADKATECSGCDWVFTNGCSNIIHDETDGYEDANYHGSVCNTCDKPLDLEPHVVYCDNLGTCEWCYADEVNYDRVHHRYMEYSGDEKMHRGVCTACGAVEEEAHRSSCDDPDYCYVCHMTCDASNVTNHGSTSDEYFCDETYHWYYCYDCDQQAYKEEHKEDPDSPGFCRECGVIMGKLVEITGQPESVTVASGKLAEVTVEAEGDGLTYQWYVKVKGTSTFKKSSVSGATYSVTMTSARDGNQVYCVVTDKYGSSKQTDTVTIAMLPELKITKQPASVEVEYAQTAKVSVTAEGDGPTYAWYVKSVGTSTFKKSSLTGSSYSVKMTTARNGNQVYCVVTDEHGNSVQSDTVTLTMKASSLKITQQPASVEVASGQTAKVSVAAEGEGLSYKWYVKAVGASKFTKSSLTGSSYSVKMTSARNGNQVYCIVTDKSGATVQSNTVTLTMKASSLKITQQPASVEVANGQTAKVSVAAEGEGLSYKWYVKAVGTSQFTKSSLTGSSYSVKMTTARNGNQVYCVVTDKSGATVQSNTVTLTMKVSSLKITQQPVSVEVASGKTAKVSVTAEGEGLSYKWYVKAAGTSTFKKSSLTGSSYSVTMTSARNGNQVYCIVTDKSGNTVQSNTVTLTIAAKLAITKQPVSVSVASGAKASVKVEATGDGLTYQWYVKTAGTSTFKKSSTTGASYSVTMTSARNGNQVYCIVTDKNGNTVQSNTVTLSKK